MGVIGPIQDRSTFITDWKDKKKILKENSIVPQKKNLKIHFLSSIFITETNSKANPWYIMYRAPVSKECNDVSVNNVFKR